MKVGDSAAGAPFVEQLEIEAPVSREGVFAASQHEGPEEQMALVHQARLERLRSEIRPAHGQVASFAGFPA